MTIFLQQSDVTLFAGTQFVSGALVWGGGTIATTGSSLDQVISGSCAEVESALHSSGYNPTQDYGTYAPGAQQLMQKAALLVSVRTLYNRTGRTPPADVLFQIQNTEGWLMKLHKGDGQLPGVKRSRQGAYAGGHAMGRADKTDLTNVNDFDDRVLGTLL